MLSDVITSTRMRYAFAGTAFGSVFTSCALAYDALFVSGRTVPFLSLFQDSPVNMAMATVPAILGYTFYKIGESRAELVEELERRRMAERSLEYSAYHDSLTSLKNRHALEKDLAAIIAEEGGKRPALMLLDLDKFKFINDTMGHNVGDEILLALSKRLKQAAGSDQEVYRLGGDEFVILWRGGPPEAVVRQFCEALLALISFPFDLDDLRLSAGGSVGVTWVQAGDATMSDVLRRADLALYRSKELPGSQYMLYDRLVAYEAEQRMQMEKDLRLAIEDRQFFLEYQPIISLKDDAIKGFEALIRWRFGTEVIRPDMFIPVAERSGLIVPIGKLVLEEACTQAATWPGDIGISVNVAGEQFKDKGFVKFVEDVLCRTGLETGRLTIEVTESLFLVDVDIVRHSLERLRAMGVRLALDDFGTGFSSVNHLRSFPLDTLKIDRSFTEMMLHDGREAELVRVMLHLSEAFGMTTTVEGVETSDQLDFIRNAGAGDAQGFFFSRPVGAEAVDDLIAARAGPGPVLAAARPATLHRLHA